MAKRESKSPASNEPAEAKPFQVPERGSPEPNPWESVAASVPRLPGNHEVTAITPPVSKPKPAPPAKEFDYNPNTVQRSKPTLLHPTLTMTRPLQTRLTVLATELLGTCAMANELGIRQPGKLLVSFSTDRKWFYMMPVNHKTDLGIEVKYRQNQATMNLWRPFEESGKIVEKGYRENYLVEMTDEPVTIHGVKGYALYIYLVDPVKEAIESRDEAAESASGKSTRTPRQAKQTAAPQGAPATGSAALPEATQATDGVQAPAAAPQSAEESAQMIRKLQEMVDKRDNTIDERDAEIEDLVKTIEAYREKYGLLE